MCFFPFLELMVLILLDAVDDWNGCFWLFFSFSGGGGGGVKQ